MLQLVCIRRCFFVAVCGVLSLGGAGCAGTLSHDETTAELERLRTAVRQSEARVLAMQSQQTELSQQVKVLSVLIGLMANEAARRDEIARKKQGLTGIPAASAAIPADPTKQTDSPELEF
jgi:delta 1-pyrroline-5-carboxylate dehydrogenase